MDLMDLYNSSVNQELDDIIENVDDDEVQSLFNDDDVQGDDDVIGIGTADNLFDTNYVVIPNSVKPERRLIYTEVNELELSTEIYDAVKKKIRHAQGFKAFQNEAEHASTTNGYGKKSLAELEEEYEQRENSRKYQEENRKEALRDLGNGLVEAAKTVGKGVKETAFIAYNLAVGGRAGK